MVETVKVAVPTSDSKVIATVSTPAASKINWTAGIALVASILATFGIEMSPETQLLVLKILSIGAPIVIGILRTFFTNTKPSIG